MEEKKQIYGYSVKDIKKTSPLRQMVSFFLLLEIILKHFTIIFSLPTSDSLVCMTFIGN